MQEPSDRLTTEPERITLAALRQPHGKVWWVPRPGRHHDVIRVMRDHGLSIEAVAVSEQGFQTSRGRFVGRVEALALAQAAEQIIQKTGSADLLFSEDVW